MTVQITTKKTAWTIFAARVSSILGEKLTIEGRVLPHPSGIRSGGRPRADRERGGGEFPVGPVIRAIPGGAERPLDVFSVRLPPSDPNEQNDKAEFEENLHDAWVVE